MILLDTVKKRSMSEIKEKSEIETMDIIQGFSFH